MEIRTLITFQKILETGSFTKAADALGYSQSTVTMQIKQLEAELGVLLFDRMGHKTSVNHEGLRFAKYASRIIAEANNALADLSSDGTPKGTLRIGILESICTAHLPLIVSQYHTLYPDVTTVIKIGTFPELQTMLNSGQIDILWTFDHLLHPLEWTLAFTYESPIIVVCSPDSPLLTKESLQLKDIAYMPFILTEKDCSYRIAFSNALAAKGYTPNVFLEIGSTELIKKFLEADLGLSVLPQYTVASELERNTLRTLSITDFDLHMHGQLFFHKSMWISPAITAFIQIVSTVFTAK
ncbi:MAG: LysR family transcriptional regulator [bacterium]|nr:LysR family transcriptional regulator [bacterium]